MRVLILVAALAQAGAGLPPRITLPPIWVHASMHMEQDGVNPREDPDARCRKGPSDLAKKEYECGCEVACGPEDANGHREQIEAPGCSTNCHALVRKDPETGAITRQAGCLCHPDLRANVCDPDPLLK